MRSGERAAPGFTLLAVLLLVAVLSTTVAVAGPRWVDAVKREREQELLRIGAQYARALQAYRKASPGAAPQNPRRLEQLLLDDRFTQPVRHLRRLYDDPVSREPFGVLRDGEGGIVGVYSRSDAAPVARGPQTYGELRLPAAVRYLDWHFTPFSDDPATPSP